MEIKFVYNEELKYFVGFIFLNLLNFIISFLLFLFVVLVSATALYFYQFDDHGK